MQGFPPHKYQQTDLILKYHTFCVRLESIFSNLIIYGMTPYGFLSVISATSLEEVTQPELIKF